MRSASGPHRIGSAVPAQTVFRAAPGDVPFQGDVGVSLTLPRVFSAETGLLLMVHGLGSDWDEHDALAADWCDRFDLICIQVKDRHAGPRGLRIPVDLGKYQTIDCLRALQWTIQRYEPNPRRLFVWGGSGGGHIALMCLVMAPELFAGGIACCPYTHPTLPGQISGEWQDGWMLRCIPRGPVPEEEIRVRSPLLLRHRLRTPLVVLHGEADEVVRVEHSRRLVSALRRMGRAVSYHEIRDGDHDFFGGPPGFETRRNATESAAAGMIRGARQVPGSMPCGEYLGAGYCIEQDPLGWPHLAKMGESSNE